MITSKVHLSEAQFALYERALDEQRACAGSAGPGDETSPPCPQACGQAPWEAVLAAGVAAGFLVEEPARRWRRRGAPRRWRLAGRRTVP